MPTIGNTTASKPAPPVGIFHTKPDPASSGVFFGPRMRYPAGAVMMPRHFGDHLMYGKFENELETVGVAQTRCYELARAADRIHTAVCALDISNRERLAKHYPAFLQLAEEFASFDKTLLADMGVKFKRAKGAKS